MEKKPERKVSASQRARHVSRLEEETKAMEEQLKVLQEKMEVEKQKRSTQGFHWRSSSKKGTRPRAVKTTKSETNAVAVTETSSHNTLSPNNEVAVTSKFCRNQMWVPPAEAAAESTAHMSEEPSKGGSLLDGEYDEKEAENSFQEALREWRSGGSSSQPDTSSEIPAVGSEMEQTQTTATESQPFKYPAQSHFHRMLAQEADRVKAQVAAVQSPRKGEN